jgi:DNA-binding LacI/PurR family transcriptional regulator
MASGERVSEDLSVIGYNDEPLAASHPDYDDTSVVLLSKEMQDA